MLRLSEKALVCRINRRLAPDMEQLCKARGARCELELGEYYIRDHNRNFIVAHHVDPEQLGRELGVLKHYEQVT
jgi:hypothetical protein